MGRHYLPNELPSSHLIIAKFVLIDFCIFQSQTTWTSHTNFCCLFTKNGIIYLNLIELLNPEVSTLGKIWFCFPGLIFTQIFSHVLCNHDRLFLPNDSLKLYNLRSVDQFWSPTFNRHPLYVTGCPVFAWIS